MWKSCGSTRRCASGKSRSSNGCATVATRPQCPGALDAIQQAAATDENLVPLMLDAVKQSATLGEISDSLRQVWGEYRERIVV